MPSILRAVIDSLWPEGFAWDLAPDDDLDKLLNGLAENFEILRELALSVGQVRSPLETSWLDDLEREFGILPNISLTEEVRREQLQAWKHDPRGFGSPDDLEFFLRRAGFDVQVHANDPPVDPTLFPGDVLLNGALNTAVQLSLMGAGSAVAYAGHVDAKAGRFQFTREAVEYTIPNTPDYWEWVFFVGSDATRDGSGALTSVDTADVPADRQSALIDWILKLKPLGTWAVLRINYI